MFDVTSRIAYAGRMVYATAPGRSTILDRRILPGLDRSERQAWIKRRVGTVHTFQRKEAEAVILMLGAGRGARPGSRAWADGRPNLLNVAVTRAKNALYIVGNREEWQNAGVFAEAAYALPPRDAAEWREALPLSPIHAMTAGPDGRTAAALAGGWRKVRAPRNDGAG